MALVRRFPADTFVVTLPPSQLYRREHMVNLVWQAVFAPEYGDLRQPTDASLVQRRRKHCSKLIDRMVRDKFLIELSDGRLRRNTDPRHDNEHQKITFGFRGVIHTCDLLDYEAKVAELKAATPEAIHAAELQALKDHIELLQKEIQR